MTGYSTYRFETLGREDLIIPVAVGYYDANTREYFEFLRMREEDDVLWRFLCFLKERHKRSTSPIDLHAHLGSETENKLILDTILSHEDDTWRLPYGGTLKISWNIRPDLKRGLHINFLDAASLNSWKTIEEAAANVGANHTQLPEVSSRFSDAAALWEIGERMATFRTRVEKDCLLLSACLEALERGVQDYFPDVPSKLTMAGYAQCIAQLFYPMREIPDNKEFAPFIRATLYGGRSEVYRRYGENINHYDAYMHHTSCFLVPLPIGKLAWMGHTSIDRGTLAEARVRVPTDWYVGPLPHRYEGHIIFPVGEFQDWWDMRELRYAASLGVDVTLIRQLECEEEVVLDGFAQAMAEMRKRNTPPYEALGKKLPNLLAGKTLQRPMGTEHKNASEIDDLAGWLPLDSQWLIWEKTVDLEANPGKRSPPWARPQIGMRIYAEGRIKHHQIIMQALERGDIFYGDTDSIFTTATLSCAHNPSIGDLMLKDTYPRGYFIRQKLYALVPQTGMMRQRIAGYVDCKLCEKDFQQLLAGEEVMEQHTQGLSDVHAILNGDLHPVDYHRILRGTMPENRIYSSEDSQPIRLPL